MLLTMKISLVIIVAAYNTSCNSANNTQAFTSHKNAVGTNIKFIREDTIGQKTGLPGLYRLLGFSTDREPVQFLFLNQFYSGTTEP